MAAEIVDKTRIPALMKELEFLATHQVSIGVFGEQESFILMIANVHEFGCVITVTPKMRGYLHYTGLHLRATTEVITIPERSFIRGTIDTKNAEIDEMLQVQLNAVIAGSQTGKGALERIGIYVTGLIQRYMTDLSEPQLHEYTIVNKRSSQPLVDTGRLRQSITWQIEAVGRGR